MPILKEFSRNIKDYKISSYKEYLEEDETYTSKAGFIYNQTHISEQINYEIQEALNMVKEQYCQDRKVSSDYIIKPFKEENESWIIINKNGNEDYVLLEDDEAKLINAVSSFKPITTDMLIDYNTIENIVIVDNAKQAYKQQEQLKNKTMILRHLFFCKEKKNNI